MVVGVGCGYVPPQRCDVRYVERPLGWEALDVPLVVGVVLVLLYVEYAAVDLLEYVILQDLVYVPVRLWQIIHLIRWVNEVPIAELINLLM
jgi:hypothetical protein